MTTDELNAIVQAVMLEMEKAGVDFDFKAEVPQPTDLVYVMRGTADKYQGITVKWQNLLDIIVQKATEARDEAISAKDIALETLATIQGIESNVSSMKASVETTKSQVETMKASVETSEANVTQMKSDVSEMKTSVENTKTEVENIKEETAGLLGTKVSYSDSLTYEEIMATNIDLTNKVASASALKELATLDLLWENASPTSEFINQTLNLDFSTYSLIGIIFKAKTESINLLPMQLLIKGSLFECLFKDGGEVDLYLGRVVNITDNGITFGEGFRPNIGYNNYYCIPMKIYGVK